MQPLKALLEPVFPAWAGVSLWRITLTNQAESFPRVGGGEPEVLRLKQITGLFSPRGRG